MAWQSDMATIRGPASSTSPGRALPHLVEKATDDFPAEGISLAVMRRAARNGNPPVTAVWTALVATGTLVVVAIGTFFAIRHHRRILARPELQYAVSQPDMVGTEPDPLTGVDETFETELMFRNASQDVITARIRVRFDVDVTGISRIVSTPRNRERPRSPTIQGRTVLIEPLTLCADQAVRITVRTADAPRSIRPIVDAPEVRIREIEWHERIG